MRYGFWTDFDELQEEQPDATWGYLENEVEYHGITPYDFLHGDCNIFAEYLHKKCGYNIEAVFEEPSQLIHMYCTTVSPFGEKLYVDVRGVNSDFGKFMQENEVHLCLVGATMLCLIELVFCRISRVKKRCLSLQRRLENLLQVSLRTMSLYVETIG